MILHTEIFGNGEPIVFLHTGLQTGLTDFEYQREYSQKNFKVILPDLRGHGNSKAEDFSNFFEDSASDLAETLDYLKIEKAHIVGCSLGGLVGLFFAKKFPKRLLSLSLSGVSYEKPDNWLELHKEDVKFQSQLLQDKETVHFFNQLHKSDWKQLLELSKDENWYPFEVTKDLNGISAPILFVVGESNHTETKGTIHYPKNSKNVHVSIIPFAGHQVHAEQPEIYTKILELFLQNIQKD